MRRICLFANTYYNNDIQEVLEKSGYSQGLQFLQLRRNLPSIVLAVVCAACVAGIRSIPGGSTLNVAGVAFSFSDIFVILVAGIGGLGTGLFSFSLLFFAEMLRLEGDFMGLYALVTYLIIVLISARIAYKGWFAGLFKIIGSICILTLALALCWYFTFTLLLEDYDQTNVFLNMPFLRLIVGAIPESAVAVLATAAFFRFAPVSIKLKFGNGWLYTGSKTAERRHHYVLSARLTLHVLLEAVIITLAAIVFSDIQMGIVSGRGLSIRCFFEMWRLNLQMGFMTACVAIPIAYLLNRYIMKNVVHPINAMSIFMEQYFNGADGGGRLGSLPDLGIHSGDEIEQLYNSLRKMVHDMAGYLDTQEQKAALEMEVKSARAANKAKSDFLSNMSHEIRTPINAVLGLDEMILRECDDNTIRSYAADIQSSGKMLLSIINDILDFSKIEAGKMEIIPVNYDLSAVISDLVNMIANRAESKGLQFVVNVDPKMPHLLFGDETRIKQCILNILTNAVKYTKKGSVTLNVGCEYKDNERIFLKAQVIDTGIGIKENDLKKLFSPFERIEESRNRAIEGTGLGMSIVKSLLAAMGTQLEVKSEYGKGSDFSFAVEQGVTNWAEIGNYAETKEKAAQNAAAYTEQFQAPGAKILVVDDTPMNLTVIRGLLKTTRVQLETAQDAITALTVAQKTPYHLIFIDHLMPKMDGIEMLRELRGDRTSVNQNTPCIALTANAIGGAREMYLEAGFADYLSKPVDSAKLEAVLAERLPAQLVLHKGDEGFVERTDSRNGTERQAGGSAAGGASADPVMLAFFGIDSAATLKNCGSTDVLKDAIQDFYAAIPEKSALIAQYAAAGDWKNYTVLVHALKSSARLIGATALSELARELEAAGDAAQKATKNGEGTDGASNASASPAAIIAKKTPALLAAYRAYSQTLAPLCTVQSPAPVQETRPIISAEKLAEAFSALREVATAFDFDTADSIISELDGYTLPAEVAPRYAEIKSAIRAADSAKTVELLEKLILK